MFAAPPPGANAQPTFGIRVRTQRRTRSARTVGIEARDAARADRGGEFVDACERVARAFLARVPNVGRSGRGVSLANWPVAVETIPN